MKTVKKGLVFDIQRFSIHDGPGIRTTVFFKGCPMKCMWCQNPESLKPYPEIGFYSSQCFLCKRCKTVCQQNCINFDSPGRIERKKCIACGKCTQICPSDALRLIGRYYSAEELVEKVMRDKKFFEESGGGVTLSGGEPFFQHDFILDFTKLLKDCKIHITVETAGNVQPSIFRKLCDNIDLFLYDLKIMDSTEHKKYTGVDNTNILNNLFYLLDADLTVNIRVPLVPRYTLTPKNLCAIGRFLKKIGVHEVYILKYHPMGDTKLKPIESTQPKLNLKPPSDKVIENAVKILKESFGKNATLKVLFA